MDGVYKLKKKSSLYYVYGYQLSILLTTISLNVFNIILYYYTDTVCINSTWSCVCPHTNVHVLCNALCDL